MAPLLGRKPYPLVKPLSEPPGPAEEVFIIEHTKEAFRNKEEYEARLRRYAERIWTCKSTGSSQLTHKEAWEEEQEVTELLQEEYPVWFEKPVLEIVHHNTVSLDKLVDLVWLEILTKYAVDEECDFLVGKDKTLHVKVVKIHPLENPPEENVEKKMEGACDSPSSDKENASQENLKKEPQSKEEDSRRESLFKMPRKLPTSMKEEKKKWVMPKFLPHKYDVKLLNEDKVISDVPADSLFRTERPPNKEIMRYFIRHYALRLGSGESAPWVVEDELVKKYNLPSKFSDFLLDPHKFLAENPSAKRKSMSSPEGKPNKKLKTAETGKDSEGVKVKGEKKKKKKDSQNIPLSPTLWGHMQVKKVNGSPLKMKNSGTSKKSMVVEFLHCYSGLLMPDDQYPITSIALMEALAGEKAGFLYLNRVLVVLLQTLLQDELAEGYSELDMPLSEIPLTMHSISELVRLCLRPTDAHEEESARGSDDWQPGVGYDDVVSSEFLEKLETSEVFELNSQEKVSLLVALCHRILMTYSVEDHVEATQQRLAELWRERLATLKEVNERKKAEKQKRKEQMEAKTDASGEVLMRADGRKDSNVIKETPKVPAKVEPEPEDMISTVKSRRLMSIQAKKEKEEQERQNKERMEKEAEEERIRKQKAAAEKALQDAVTKAKLVLRRTPLGTDRNHNRYWLFSDVVPGLYIEKGWVHESIDYTFTLPPEEEPASTEEDKEEETEDGEKEDEGSIVSTSNENGQQGAPVPESCIETTVPKQGQNLWFVCDSQKDLDELIESLHPQGVRESELKLRLQVNYQEILHSIHLTKKGNPGLKICDGYQELLKFLRSDIIEVASRLQKGGLGYMEDTSEFEERVRDLEKLQDFGECVITLQESVIKKFLQGFMAPKQKKKKKTGGEESTTAEEVDDQKRLAEEARVATAVEKWKTAVREAQTCSRMHVLLGMLDACIKWDMSAENARCKVCRRKGEDDKLILCDECNKAFHLFCLRPALYRIPAGEWLCPACQPTTARRSSRGRNYNEDTEEEEDSEEEDEEDSEEEESEEEYRNTGHSCECHSEMHGIVLLGTIYKCFLSVVDCVQVRQSSKSLSKKQAIEVEKCEEILQKLIKYRHSWPFREPVSAEEAEDYRDIISCPMDFTTMQDKFKSSQYHNASDFVEDVKLVFSNAEEYNEPDSDVLTCMVCTEQAFIELLQKSLPGIGYLRRRSRKRPAAHSEEEEEEEEERGKKIQNGKQGRASSRQKEDDEEDSGRRKTRQSGGQWNQDDSESEEDEEEDESVRRKSKRTNRKDYREQDSDNERDSRRTGLRRTARDVTGDKEASSDEDSGVQRHSKRLKRS
uniref:Tyrosine-protein kinase BAZ1B n=1 Tax=Sinocyclocheilus anshuiensis TaxID=1608454 RepID=A0A671MSV9_9TELE